MSTSHRDTPKRTSPEESDPWAEHDQLRAAASDHGIAGYDATYAGKPLTGHAHRAAEHAATAAAACQRALLAATDPISKSAARRAARAARESYTLAVSHVQTMNAQEQEQTR